MDIVSRLSGQLQDVKRSTGKMPRVLFVAYEDERKLRRELIRRGLYKSGPLKLLGVRIKEFEIVTNDQAEEAIRTSTPPKFDLSDLAEIQRKLNEAIYRAFRI